MKTYTLLGWCRTGHHANHHKTTGGRCPGVVAHTPSYALMPSTVLVCTCDCHQGPPDV